PLVDADRYVMGVFGGHPRDRDWKTDVAQKAADLMEEAANGIYNHTFSGKIPRRGPIRPKTMGNSMGGGQEAPMGFFNSVLHTIVLTGLLASEPFQRIAGFTNGTLYTYAPDLHAHYSTTLDHLHQWNHQLKRNFLPSISVFAAATFNFGLRTVTYPHLDFANLAWGWCAITALGDFDPDKGGHLILWDLKLIIRFPPGCTILIPSALIRHSNTSIQPHEKRFSFTQYTPAGIFRFVANGFRSDVDVNASVMTDAERVAREDARRNRWVEGLKMYRRWE
ncbi:hypothetical protein B0H14DRAFT_2394264, partial [Mycena olivaceomarginata]